MKLKIAYAVIAVALLAQYRGGPALAFDLGGAVALASMVCAALSIVARRPVESRVLALASGALCAAIAWRAPALACATAIFAVSVHAARAALGVERRDSLVRAALAGVGLVSLGAASALGWFGVAFVALKALVVVLLADREERDARLVTPFVMLFTLALVVRRLVEVAAMAGNDGAVFWAEEPFLVDMLKLDAHRPLYGPVAELGAYTYSPGMQLAHHALLAPLHIELSLGANRALTLADQLVATALFVWALAPHVKEGIFRMLPSRADMWALGVALLAGFSSLLAGALHPDHPTLACAALAFALLVRGESLPRWLYWSALLLVTPVASAFKLTGAGVGLGLGVVMLVERRRREILVLAASALLTVATIPLFDATLGSFSEYAIRIQRSHPLEWARLALPPTIQFAAAGALAAAVSFGLLGGNASVVVRRAAIFFACLLAAFMPAYVKYAGRENNLVVLVIGAVAILVVAGARASRGPLVPALVVYVLALVATPKAHGAASPLSLEEQTAAAERALAEDDAAHEASWASATLLIRHGDREPPRDCINVAYELFYGKRPEAELFFDHLGDGRYRSVVMVSGDLHEDATLRGQFATRLRDTLSHRYDVVYPTVPVPDEVNHLVIFRRKP